MRLKFCCICGVTNNLHHHHIIPRSRGGTDDETNYLTLCGEHHGWIHSIRPNSWNNHPQLIKEGVARAREQGVRLGRPSNVTKNTPIEVKKLREKGMSIKNIAKELSIGIQTVYKVMSDSFTFKEIKLKREGRGTLEKFL